MRQIFLSLRNLRASTKSEGSMMPPRRRSTKCRVDSGIPKKKAKVTECRATPFSPSDCHLHTEAQTHAAHALTVVSAHPFLQGQSATKAPQAHARTHAHALAACRGTCSLTLLDVVIRKGTSILQLLPSEDEALLIRGDALLVLNLGLDHVDCVG